MTDLRGVAWDSEAILESEVIPTLRDILADTLDRIRTEVFDIRRTSPADGAPPAEPADTPEPPQPPAPPAASGARGTRGLSRAPGEGLATRQLPRGRDALRVRTH